MQHPIGEHALLADSRTAALIDPDGNVAWLCWPRIDSTPLLFSILDDERGGGFRVRPAHAIATVVSRRYHPRSLVLETTWQDGGARLIVDDALDLGEHPALVRRLRAEGGAVEVAAEFRTPVWPGRRYDLHANDGLLELGGEDRAVVRAPSTWTSEHGRLVCRFVVQPGRDATLTLAAPETDATTAGIDRALAGSRRTIPELASLSLIDASRAGTGESTLRELLGTTAAVLAGLRHHDGGIVAAPTTSLPQWPGSARTWDYRYAWLRDSSLAAIAMLRLGMVDAARGLGAFIGAVIVERGPVPLVRVDGSDPPAEREMTALAGYGGARPVRIGNAAAGQAQLDVPGEVIELATSLATLSAMPSELRAAVPILAGWLTEHLHDPDNGIWEIRGARRRYTHSMVTAASGLSGAADLAAAGLVAGDAARWRGAASEVIEDLGSGGGALQLRIDGGGADAALAQLTLLGGLEPLRLLVPPTLDLIVERLDRGGLIDRYEGQPDTLSDPCAPFVFPTFWLAGALNGTGRDGSRWLDAALATRGPLGLFGEVADPTTHTPLGNYPQVQSHAAFALAVVAPPAAPPARAAKR